MLIIDSDKNVVFISNHSDLVIFRSEFNEYNKHIMQLTFELLHYFIYSHESIRFSVFFAYFFEQDINKLCMMKKSQFSQLI